MIMSEWHYPLYWKRVVTPALRLQNHQGLHRAMVLEYESSPSTPCSSRSIGDVDSNPSIIDSARSFDEGISSFQLQFGQSQGRNQYSDVDHQRAIAHLPLKQSESKWIGQHYCWSSCLVSCDSIVIFARPLTPNSDWICSVDTVLAIFRIDLPRLEPSSQ